MESGNSKLTASGKTGLVIGSYGKDGRRCSDVATVSQAGVFRSLSEYESPTPSPAVPPAATKPKLTRDGRPRQKRIPDMNPKHETSTRKLPPQPPPKKQKPLLWGIKRADSRNKSGSHSKPLTDSKTVVLQITNQRTSGKNDAVDASSSKHRYVCKSKIGANIAASNLPEKLPNPNKNAHFAMYRPKTSQEPKFGTVSSSNEPQLKPESASTPLTTNKVKVNVNGERSTKLDSKEHQRTLSHSTPITNTKQTKTLAAVCCSHSLDCIVSNSSSSEPGVKCTQFSCCSSVCEGGSTSSTYKLSDCSDISTTATPMRDTGQTPTDVTTTSLSRASSPSSAGSSYNLSGASSSDLSGLRATPMGSTTGLIVDNTSSKFKWGRSWMPGLGTTLAILSLSAGFGNVVRLPATVYNNGGGAFLVVYIGISLVFGIPLVFLEIGLGQLCQKGTTKLWRAVPLFRGVGYVKILGCIFLSVYYPILMAVSLFYTVWIARGPLPFEECTDVLLNGVDVPIVKGEHCLRSTFLMPLEEDSMWYGVNVAFIFLFWAFLMLFIFKGKHSYRTTVHFIYSPIVICLIGLLIEAISRDPTVEGLKLLTSSEWNNLLDVKIWYFATIQMLFSTHLGFGNIVSCAGSIYSKSNAFWAAVMYVVCNLLVGVLSICVVYMWIGQLHSKDLVVTTPELPELLVFTVLYDTAVHCMGGTVGQAVSSIAYLAYMFSGFISMISLLYTIIVAVPLKRNGIWQWWHISGGICILGFLIGIPSMVPHDLVLMHIFDHYIIGRMVMLSMILELIAFAWIYGCPALYNDFQFVLGRKLTVVWKIVWIVAPLLLIVVEVSSVVSLPRTGILGSPSDPVWVYTTGWAVYLVSWVIIIVAAIKEVTKQVDYNLAQKIKSALKPSRTWGPVDPTYRHDWIQWRFKNNKCGQKDFTFKRRGTKDYTRFIRKSLEPIGMHYRVTLSGNDSPQSHRTRDKGPFTIQPAGELGDHVCWRAHQMS